MMYPVIIENLSQFEDIWRTRLKEPERIHQIVGEFVSRVSSVEDVEVAIEDDSMRRMVIPREDLSELAISELDEHHIGMEIGFSLYCIVYSKKDRMYGTFYEWIEEEDSEGYTLVGLKMVFPVKKNSED